MEVFKIYRIGKDGFKEVIYFTGNKNQLPQGWKLEEYQRQILNHVG